MSEWKSVKLGELYEVHNGLSKGRKFFGSGYPFLSFSTVFNNYFIPNELTDLVQSTESERNSYSIHRGDIFVTRTSETSDELGMSCVALKDYPDATYNGFTKRMRPITDRVLPEYIGYYMRMPSFRGEFQAFSTMTTRASLKNEDLLSLSVCLPSLDEQNRIAQALLNYDNLIENNQKQIKLLEEAAQRLYKEWFVDLRFPGYEDVQIVDGVPAGWHKGTVQEIVKYHDTMRKPLSGQQREKMKGKYRYYGAAGVLDYVNKYIFDGTYLLLGEDGTVITNDGLPVLQYVTGQFWVNNHAHVLTGKGNYSTEFIYMMFSFMGISDVVTGVAQPKISQGRLSAKKVVIPSEGLAVLFHNNTKPIFDRVLLLEKQITLFSEARDRLLPKLMSGEIEL